MKLFRPLVCFTTSRKVTHCLTIVAIGLLICLNLGADSIPINNASFETPALASNGFTTGSIPGWAVSGATGVGVWRPPGSFFATIPDGLNVGWASQENITQTLSDTYLEDATYTLTAWIGQYYNNGGSGDIYTIELMAGYAVLASFSEATMTITPGTFVERTVTFTPDASSSAIGQPIEIGLLNPGFLEADFDRISLTETPGVPEPGSAILLFAGLGIVAARKYWGATQA